MICCEKCFKDIEIKAIIKSKCKKGKCDVCSSRDVYIYNTDEDSTLEEMFNEILDIYYLENELGDDFPEDKLTILKYELHNNWNIFDVKPDKISLLIKNICKTRYEENARFFRNSIGIKEFLDYEYLNNNSIMKTYTWDEFAEQIKIKCRFHNDYFNKKAFSEYLKYMNKTYKKGHIFYRARISNSKGYNEINMGAPPVGMASSGRANPMGISYLYLASNEDTAISEIRAGALDYVTIAKFELLKDINVIDFKKIDYLSPFLDGMNTIKFGINNFILKRIGEEISRPLGGDKRELEYLPTQYIVDYIKSIGEWQGIEYKSTLGRGYNLAIFNENLFKCVDVEVKQIGTLNYSYL